MYDGLKCVMLNSKSCNGVGWVWWCYLSFVCFFRGPSDRLGDLKVCL